MKGLSLFGGVVRNTPLKTTNTFLTYKSRVEPDEKYRPPKTDGLFLIYRCRVEPTNT